jgi:AraC-like DNA-binding protein
VYARLLRMLLERSDVDSERVLASARLQWDTLVRDESRLQPSTVASLVQAAIAATGKPWLGLELGWQMPVSAHGDLAYAAVTAPNLGAALVMLARYGVLRDDTFVWTLSGHPQGATLQAAQRTDWGTANAFVMDTVVAAFLRVIEASVGQWPNGVQLDLPISRPTWAAQYARVSPLEVRFGQPALAFTFERATLALPCIGSDAQAHANACRACESLLSVSASASYTDKVSRALARAGAGRYPQLGEVADECGVSPRTLMRQLQAEATSFQALLDADRKARAQWLLQHKGLSVEEVAEQLGYADTSNFSRTVRRWFGVTPRALRDSGSQGRVTARKG